MRKKAGFTLVEIIIVVSIIAILAAILIPVMINVTDNAKETELYQNARNTYAQYVTDHAKQLTDHPGEVNISRNLIYIDDGRYAIIKDGAVIATVYSSEIAALKALFDDPATGTDESVDVRVEATGYDKLFSCELKTRA